MRLIKKVAIILVTATRLKSLKHFFRAFYFLSTYLAFNINGLQILPIFQLIKLAIQASCSLCFSRSFIKSAGLTLSYLLVKLKSAYFSLINLSVGRGYSGLLRTHLMFLDQRWFYILILNISQSSYLTSFQIEARAVYLLLILVRLYIIYSLQALLRQYYQISFLYKECLYNMGFNLIYSLASKQF